MTKSEWLELRTLSEKYRRTLAKEFDEWWGSERDIYAGMLEEFLFWLVDQKYSLDLNFLMEAILKFESRLGTERDETWTTARDTWVEVSRRFFTFLRDKC